MIKTWLTEEFGIQAPIIMAPMFLVSDENMLVAAAKAGIMGCAPALNWRTPEEFQKACQKIKEQTDGPWGINIICNQANLQLARQIEVCAEEKPSFIITSLGSPENVIKACKPVGIKIFADVVDIKYAKKVEALGADAVIAVNSGAGGHAGPISASILVPMLKEKLSIPVISAGGVGTGAGLLSVVALGAEGVSIGSPFISATESPVNADYKKAIIDHGANDIAFTTKLSGTPCTVIKTPYVEKIGLDQNIIESFLNKNKKFKKYAKMITSYKGMRMLEKAAFSATYKSIWCAGPSIEFIHEVEPVDTFIKRLMKEYEETFNRINEIGIP